jgi:tetratricopeptide (TPR) repeat protein
MDFIAPTRAAVSDSRITDQAKGGKIVKQISQVGEQNVAPFLAPPQSSHDLIGRDALLQDLKQKLFDGDNPSLHVLAGLPGVGKTALAMALAYDSEVIEFFSEGVLWVGLGRQPDVLTHLGVWCMALGMTQFEVEKLPSIKARQHAIRAAIGMRRMLLVIDDAWQVEKVLDFKLGGPRCAYLITTRLLEVASRLAGEKIIAVHELDEDNGLALLAHLASEVVKVEPKGSRELVQAVGGLPLALVLLGNYLRVQAHGGQMRRLHKALDQMRYAEDRLKLEQPRLGLEMHPGLPVDTPLSLMAVIRISDEALDEFSRHALRSLAALPPKPSTFSEQAALAVAEVSAETLDTLVDSGLLESSGLGRYMLHQTISDYARSQLRDLKAFERMVEFFVSFVEDHEIDYSTLDHEASNVLTALISASEKGMRELLIRGANAFFAYLQPRGLYILAKEYLTLAEQAAISLGDTVGLAKTLLNLGETAGRQGNYVQAEEYLQKGLSLVNRDEHYKIISSLLRNLGEVARDRGDYEQAEGYLRQGLALARQIGHIGTISAVLASMGAVANHLGNYPQSEEYLRESLALAYEIDHRARISGVLSTLGDVFAQLGDYAQAGECLQEGLRIARQCEHQGIICAQLRNLGSLAHDRGDYAQAETYLEEGLTIARGIGHLGRTSGLLANLGAVLLDKGEYLRAEENLREGLALARKIGHREYVGMILQSLGMLAVTRKDYTQASAGLQEGLRLARQIGHKRIICALLCSLGALARGTGEYEQARGQLEEGLRLAREIDHRKLISDLLSEEGELSFAQQQFDPASLAFRQALEMTRGGSQVQAAVALYGLARISAKQGNTIKARQQAQRSLVILDNVGHREAAGVRQWLGSLPSKL